MTAQFRTKSLRGVASSAPYMHAGQFATLEAVVDYYDKGGDAPDGGTKDPLMVPLGLTAQERSDLVAFLKTHGIETLKPYQDDKMGLSGALGPDVVLPTSILFDANGREVWRYVGDLDWTSPEAAKLLSEADVSSKAG
jgi:hypothetical protein